MAEEHTQRNVKWFHGACTEAVDVETMATWAWLQSLVKHRQSAAGLAAALDCPYCIAHCKDPH